MDDGRLRHVDRFPVATVMQFVRGLFQSAATDAEGTTDGTTGVPPVEDVAEAAAATARRRRADRFAASQQGRTEAAEPQRIGAEAPAPTTPTPLVPQPRRSYTAVDKAAIEGGQGLRFVRRAYSHALTANLVLTTDRIPRAFTCIVGSRR
eukprot:COSAG02_NODE_424_length_22575_cov_79.088361_4_plen_150_part_00